jgi:hypothetical protein
MKTFEILFRYQDRNNTSEGSTVKLDASNLPGAIAKATRHLVQDSRAGMTWKNLHASSMTSNTL